jgi:hypothetical protein
MKSIRIIGAMSGLIAGFVYVLFSYVMLGWGWSDSGNHWSLAQWVLTLIPWSVPFLFTFWIVYRCCCSDEMAQFGIFSWMIRPQALKRALMAEFVVLALGFLVIFFVMQRGSANQLTPLPGG